MLATIKCELKSFEDLAHSFAAKELAVNREVNDRYPFGPFFDSVVAKAYEVGLLGTILPEECGGIGQGMNALCIILDNISAADASLGGIIFTNALSQEIMLSAGCKNLLTDIAGQTTDAKSALIACPAFCNPAETQTRLTAVKKMSLTFSTALSNMSFWVVWPAMPWSRHGSRSRKVSLFSLSILQTKG